MKTIAQFRSERATVNAAVQALALIEATSGSLTTEQHTEFSALSAQFEALTGQIERAENAERMAAASAQPLPNPAQAQFAMTTAQALPATVPAVPRTSDAPGVGMARMVNALVAAQGDRQRAGQIAIDRGYGEHIAASLNILTPSAGGVLVPQNLSSEVIDLLRPKAVVRRLGARTVPLSNGNISIPRLRGGAVVGYIGSDSDIPVTKQEFGDLKLSAKTLAALVPISNDLLAYSGTSTSVDQIVIGDLTSALAAREDKAFIRDDGSQNTPKGMRNWALAANVFPATGGDNPTLQQVDADLNKAILRLEAADAGLVSPGWIMAPRVRRYIGSLRDGNGNRVYPEIDQGMLKGYPVGSTTQVPTNLLVGTDADGSEIIFADFGDMFIGESDSLMIDYSKEATYRDDNNQVISAYQRNQTLIRVIMKNDFGPRHVESISVINEVRWGRAMAD